MAQDPAARSRLEIVLCYPGFHAVTLHMWSHSLWNAKLFTLARFISHISRVLTGIEIHPGATIGRRVFIDHGMGVVVGETAVIGDDTTIYQGVTLGAGAAARMGALTRGKKRHPTLGKGVVVGSGAEIQGDILVGDNSRIASGSILLKDVPANSVVVGVPGRVIYQDGQKVQTETEVEKQAQATDPDLEAEAIKCLKNKLELLEQEIKTLKRERAADSTGIQDSTTNQASEALVQPDPVDIFLFGAGI